MNSLVWKGCFDIESYYHNDALKKYCRSRKRNFCFSFHPLLLKDIVQVGRGIFVSLSIPFRQVPCYTPVHMVIISILVISAYFFE